jgi:hypothetical protein
VKIPFRKSQPMVATNSVLVQLKRALRGSGLNGV